MNLENQIPFFENIPMDNPEGGKKKKKEINNIIYEMLNDLFLQKKVGVAKVAKETGIPFTTLDDWVNGRAIPRTDENLMKLARYFGVSVDYLCYGIGPDIDEEAG